jgi:hypothetical protein
MDKEAGCGGLLGVLVKILATEEAEIWRIPVLPWYVPVISALQEAY